VRVETATSREGLTEVFYDLHAATRRRLGVPVQGRRFFELLWDRVLEPGGGSVLVASVGNEPIAAAVFLAAGDTVIYKFGASDADAWRLRPNNALFWTAIRDACADGRRYLDFGRSDHESEGLRRFKSSWGAEEIPLVYSSTRPTAVAHTGLPGRLGRAASFVIRRSPPVVCRVIGRAFYRYAA
jgi:lipid II:glycine glycyltransferase (peptidoglycan interpeptide bridge formation enzyme)